MKSHRWKIATIVLAVVAAMGWASAPASSHVAGWAHNWSEHIKPRADKRYYTKSLSNSRYWTKGQADARYQEATLVPGQKLSGVWGVSGGAGEYGTASLDFPASVSGGVTPVWASPVTADCPGVGQAAPGFLCVYPAWTNAISFYAFAPTSGGSAVTPRGTIALFNCSTDAANARGTWTVTAGAPTARKPVSPRLPAALGG